MLQFNKTTLNGLNGHAKVRIEFSKKKKVNDKLEDNDNSNNPLNFLKNNTDPPVNSTPINAAFPDIPSNNNDIDISESSYDNGSSKKTKIKHTLPISIVDNAAHSKTKKEETYYAQQKRNMCFICKLPGHFAKECVLTKDSCYECGEKGHMAKECQAGIREAKFLTKNRIKAVFSQQSAYKFISPKTKIRNIISYMKDNELN
jgi:hypothetical protein